MLPLSPIGAMPNHSSMHTSLSRRRLIRPTNALPFPPPFLVSLRRVRLAQSDAARSVGVTLRNLDTIAQASRRRRRR